MTAKQIELMRVISLGTKDKTYADLDEIVDKVRYETTKASLQFSIRALVTKGLVERLGVVSRRGRQRQVIGATSLGMAMFSASTVTVSPDYVSTVEEDELSSAIVDLTLS